MTRAVVGGGHRMPRRPCRNHPRSWVLVVSLVLVGCAAAGGLAWDERERAVADEVAASGPVATPAGVDVLKRQLAVEGVLRRRAYGVLHRDAAMFVGDVDRAKPELVARHERLFANLVQFGFATLSYRVDREQFGQAFLDRYGASAYPVRVTMEYRIRDIDATPVRTQLGYVFVQHGGRWVLTDDDDLDGDLPAGSHREPWDCGPVLVRRDDRVVVVVERDESGLARELVRDARGAVRAVRDRWPRRWAGSGLVIALEDRRVRTADYTLAKNAEDAVAMATAVYRTLPGQVSAAGERGGSYVVVNPRYRRTISARILAHEFTHVATAPLGSSAPRWLVEGLADYVEYLPMDGEHDLDLDTYRARIGRTHLARAKRLPADEVFYASMVTSYAIGWYAVDYLVGRYGMGRVADLYADLARQGFDRNQRDRILRDHLGMTEDQLFGTLRNRARPAG